MTKSARILIRWALVVAEGHGPYLTRLESNGGMRTSTRLVELDPAAGIAITAAGRPYRLAGAADPEYGLAVAREVWAQFFDLTGSDIRTLSPDEAVAVIAANGNKPYDRTPEEKAVLAKKYGIAREDVGTVARLNVDDLIIPDSEYGEEEAFGSSNVFADLGLSNPAVRLVKADAAISITALIHGRGLTMARLPNWLVWRRMCCAGSWNTGAWTGLSMITELGPCIFAQKGPRFGV